jgi:hypothetical protein
MHGLTAQHDGYDDTMLPFARVIRLRAERFGETSTSASARRLHLQRASARPRRSLGEGGKLEERSRVVPSCPSCLQTRRRRPDSARSSRFSASAS